MKKENGMTTRRNKMKHGKYEYSELVTLQKAIWDFAKENSLDEKALEDLITSNEIKVYPKAWTEIAKALRKYSNS